MYPQVQDQKNLNTRSEIALEFPWIGKKIDSIPGGKKIGVGCFISKKWVVRL